MCTNVFTCVGIWHTTGPHLFNNKKRTARRLSMKMGRDLLAKLVPGNDGC